MKHVQPCYKCIDKVIFRALKMVPCILSGFICVSLCIPLLSKSINNSLRVIHSAQASGFATWHDDVPIDTHFFACNMSFLKSQVHSSSYLLVCLDQKLMEANNA